MRKINNILNSARKATDLPPEAISDVPYIEICGKNHIELEGVRSIVEYKEDYLRLRFHHSTVKFCGSGLNIIYFSNQSTVIEGELHSVEFE